MTTSVKLVRMLGTFRSALLMRADKSVFSLRSSFDQFEPTRPYAKQSGKGKKQMGAKILENECSQELLDFDAFKVDMKYELERYKQDILDQLSLRINLNAFEMLQIKLPDGNATVPLNHIAKVTLKNPQMVLINVTMSPDKVKLITDALANSALNVNAQPDGAMIHVPLPKVTRQHRETLSKNAKVLYNRCVERLRRVRKRYLDSLSTKESLISKDNIVSATKLLDNIVKEHAKIAEEMMKHKQKELTDENVV